MKSQFVGNGDLFRNGFSRCEEMKDELFTLIKNLNRLAWHFYGFGSGKGRKLEDFQEAVSSVYIHDEIKIQWYIRLQSELSIRIIILTRGRENSDWNEVGLYERPGQGQLVDPDHINWIYSSRHNLVENYVFYFPKIGDMVQKYQMVGETLQD